MFLEPSVVVIRSTHIINLSIYLVSFLCSSFAVAQPRATEIKQLIISINIYHLYIDVVARSVPLFRSLYIWAREAGSVDLVCGCGIIGH